MKRFAQAVGIGALAIGSMVAIMAGADAWIGRQARFAAQEQHQERIPRLTPLEGDRLVLARKFNDGEGGLCRAMSTNERKNDFRCCMILCGSETTEMCQAAARGAVRIGMTGCAVLAAWGNPERTHRTITARGTSEQWVYPSRYVYLDKDLVTAISE